MNDIKFIQAKHYKPNRSKGINLIVMHSMECVESKTTAENVALWFSSQNSPVASCHYCVDCDSIVQCVWDKDVAYHAGAINEFSIGIEMAGYAKQTDIEWHDEYSKKMLELSAELVAELCTHHNIPIEFVDAAGLLAGKRGITTHAEATKAYKVYGGHTDPGKNFPMKEYLIMVESYVAVPNE